jgi:hypothetical protein
MHPVALAEGALAAIWTHARPRANAYIGFVSDDTTHTTHFVRPDGTEVGRKPGIYLASRDQLFRWDSRRRTAPSEVCEPYGHNPYSGRVLRDGALVAVRGSQRILVADFAVPDQDGVYPEREVHVPVAILGDALFLRTEGVYYGCGLHPSSIDSFQVVRMQPAGSLEKLSMEELRDGMDARLDDAIVQLNKGFGPGQTTAIDGAVTRKDVEITMGIPTFGPEEARWSVQYTRNTAYAYGDDQWSAYTRSVRLDVPTVPARLAALATFPAVAIQYAKDHPHEEVLGVSSGVFVPPR